MSFMRYKNHKGGYRESDHGPILRCHQPLSEENFIKDPKEISKAAKFLIREKKFIDARNLLKKALERYPNDKYFHSMLIKVYGGLGDINNAREIFNEAVNKGIVNVVTYNSMIDAYYHRKKFDEIEKLISSAPNEIKNAECILLSRLEAMRKQKKYGEVLKQIENLLNNRTFKEHDSVVLARVIRAYCLKDSNQNGKAIEEFRRLKTKVPKTNIHYPRIICGLVFCHNVRNNEREQFKNDLEMWSRESTNSSLSYDIKRALESLNSRG